jgi:hypothetical protein
VFVTEYKSYIDKNSVSTCDNPFHKNYISDTKSISFVTSEKVCYLDIFLNSFEKKVNEEMKKRSGIYINYQTLLCSFELDNSKNFKFELKKFKKIGQGEKIMGYQTTKFISYEEDIIVYTSEELPWHVQPGIVNFNQFGQGIVKVVNLKSGLTVEIKNSRQINIERDVLKMEILTLISEFTINQKEINRYAPFYNCKAE